MKSALRLRAIELRAMGFTYSKIAEFTGASHPTVAKFFNDPKAWPESPPCEQQLRLARMLRGLGVPFTDIAARTGLTMKQVYDTCHHWPVVGKYVPPPVVVEPPLEQRVRDLIKQGYTYRQIADALVMKVWKVRKYGKGVTRELPPIPPRGKLPPV